MLLIPFIAFLTFSYYIMGYAIFIIIGGVAILVGWIYTACYMMSE